MQMFKKKCLCLKRNRANNPLLDFFLTPPCRRSLRRHFLPLRWGHRHQTPLPTHQTAFASHRGHVCRQIGRNRNMRFLGRILRRRLLYNPLGKLVWVAGPFSFANRHTPIIA